MAKKQPVHVEVRVRPDESFERALRRFKKKVKKEGIVEQVLRYS